MKKKTKIVVVTTAAAITSLMITAYLPEPVISPVSEVVAVGRAYTPPTVTEPIAAEEIIEISTQTEKSTHQQEVIVAENGILHHSQQKKK